MNKGTYNKEYYETHREQIMRNTRNYQKNMSSFTIRVKPSVFEAYKTAATKLGMPFRAFVLEALDEKLQKPKDDVKGGVEVDNVEMTRAEYQKKYYEEHKEQYRESSRAYKETHMKRIPLDVQNEWYNILKAYCEEQNVPIATFIRSACEQVAEQNGFKGFVEYHMSIKGLRKRTGLSQSKFAALLGIPVGTIKEWEQGRRNPPDYVINLISKVLETEITIE